VAWKTKAKDLYITRITPHASLNVNVAGMAPAIHSITFTPLELFGAAARCSHLHPVDPTLVTPESLMIGALLERHVDDASADFAILPSADNFKDFIGTYFTGAVASGIAYLAMIRNGYVWSDHFENIAGGNLDATRTPDFVFAGPTTGVALMESKGSRRGTLSAFDRRTSDGYTNQVEPHLGHQMGGIIATQGYCIGAWLESNTRATLRVHHTAATAPPPSSPSSLTGLSIVQRGNYATAFALSHSQELGSQIISGDGDRRFPFLRFQWRGRSWLTSYPVGGFSVSPGYFWDAWDKFGRSLPRSSEFGDRKVGFGFALEENVAVEALRGFLYTERGEARALGAEAVLAEGIGGLDGGEEQVSGAVFPDGLAVLSLPAIVANVQPVVWDRDRDQLTPASS